MRLVLFLAALLLAGCAAPLAGTKARSLVLATTTSTKDTGLLDLLVPVFDAVQGADVKVVAVGTGRALELGRTGDADVVLVHAPSTERAYLRNGSYTARYEVMYNQFFLVGPANDPAGARASANVTAAFAAIAQRGATFVSRGDQSGTHLREQQLWTLAGFNYSSQIVLPANAWYRSVGQGMGATLRIASEQQGYTLTDDGTWYAISPSGLVVLKQDEPPLLNQYSVLLVNATRHPGVPQDLAQGFADWLLSNATLQRIADFRVGGHQLFTPDPGVVERSPAS